MVLSDTNFDSNPAAIAPSLPDWTDLWQESLQWQPTPAQIEQFQSLYALVLAGNRQLNLTRITDPVEFLEKHVWDSLRGIQSVGSSEPAPMPASVSAIDIGTGAGFPGLPIAIAQPTWTVTLMDSTRKKITFLEDLITTLALPTVNTLVGRAEAIGQQPQHRESYHLALIRAVASATVCAEYALPLLQVGGQAVLYRGRWTAAEAAELTIATAQLGGEIATIAAFKTPITGSDRHCIYLRKIRPTPADYPRAIGIPEQKPLGT